MEELLPIWDSAFSDVKEEPYHSSFQNRTILAYAKGPRGGNYSIMPNNRAVLIYDRTRKTVPLPKYLQEMLENGEIIFDDDSNR